MNTEAPWDAMQWALMVAVFMAAALGLEGLVLLWHETRSPTVLRLRRRLHTWLPHASDEDTSPGARASANGIASPALMGLPRTRWQGLQAEIRERWQRRPAIRRAMVAQLPDALDLMARSMRSGHGFSAALQMVADDGPQPLATEFRRVAEQITLGADADAAFEALARRVPVDEIRFFVMAVRLQRKTGGQLGEVLGNIAQLVRQRLALLDKVRVLTAEGRLSAKILGALPPVTAGALMAVRPEFISVLWTDPAGVQLLKASAALMAIGGVWLWQLTRVRI